MADKITTLKTKTNDNVYPNVIGDNMKNSFVDSSTITHHFYDKTHKVGFQIANETNIKIQNSLQKPKGLTKTELVGVGTNGQENIEIGDNLTLVNGKLSATGGGSGVEQISDFNLNQWYTEEEYMGFLGKLLSINYTVDGQKVSFYGYLFGELPAVIPLVSIDSDVINISYIEITTESNSDNTKIRPLGEIKQIEFDINNKYYLHFITLTGGNLGIVIYFQLYSKRSTPYDMNSLKRFLNNRKVICTANMGTNNNLIPLYVSVEEGSLRFYYYSKNEPDSTVYTYVGDYNVTDIFSEVY